MIKPFAVLALTASICLGIGFSVRADSVPDEELQGTISVWGIPLGKGSVKIWNKVTHEGRPAMRIRAEGETTGILSLIYRVKDSMESVCNPKTFQPYVFRVDFEEGKYRRKQEFTFNHVAGKVRGSHGSEIAMVSGSLDPLSAILLLRGTPLAQGETLSRPICDGRKVYNIALSVSDREYKFVLGKKVPCWVVEPEITSLALGGILGERKFRRFRVWLTDDDQSIPTLAIGDLFFGSVVARLKARRVLSRGPKSP